MRYTFLTSITLLLFLITFAGCSGSDDNTPDGDQNDGDIIIDGDTSNGDQDTPADGDTPDGDQTDGDNSDGDQSVDGDKTDGDTPDGDIIDGDTPDGDIPDGDIIVDGDEEIDEVVQCTCSVVNDCCDGCLPINEGLVCHEGDLCQQNGQCELGTCTGIEPVVCSEGDPCTLPGVCDPQTGQCSYEPAPDDYACEFVDGLEGSGMCLAETCYGFGVCDHRTYDQLTNYPCNYDSECESGLCIDLNNDWNTFCAQRCGEDMPACPENMACAWGGLDIGKICRPILIDDTLPGDSSLGLFNVCNSDADCTEGSCLAYGSYRFCTKNCEVAGIGGSDLLCEGCGKCLESGEFGYICVPQGSNTMNQVCASGADCNSRYCLNNYCSGQCWVFAGVDTCPAGMSCVFGMMANPDTGVCTRDVDMNLGFGQACVGDWQCTSGLCREVLGEMICTDDCESATCSSGECLEEDNVSSCVPSAKVHIKPVGAYCNATLECEEGLYCYWNSCMDYCESQEQCSGECYPDPNFQVTYCSDACQSDDQCPDGMSCFDNRCVLSFQNQRYLFGYCRNDIDCETGQCINGECTTTCDNATHCEGSVLIEPQEAGMCTPCDPDNFDYECNAEGWGFNQCVTGIDGNSFCALDCGYFNKVCPTGTRCYNINGYDKLCLPVTGACSLPSTCNEDGYCQQSQPDGNPCTEQADCGSGICQNGFCQTGNCSSDADCGCDMLVCSGGYCDLSPEIDGMEIEPNNDLLSAMELNDFPTTISEVFTPQEGHPDIDLFKIHVSPTQGLDVRTMPFCDTAADTIVRLLDRFGNEIEGWINDDISSNGGNYFSVLIGYQPEQEQDVYIEVTQSPYVVGLSDDPFLLYVDRYNLAQNSTCAGADTLAAGEHDLDFSGAGANYTAANCTGWGAMGKDLAYSVEVPANHTIKVIIDAPFDSQIYLVTDCSAANDSCLAGADTNYEAGIEQFIYANESDELLSAFLIVDTFLLDPNEDTTFTLNIAYEAITAPSNNTAETALLIDSPGVYEGSTIGATNDYDPGADGCASSELIGPDVVYRADLQSGDFFAAALTSAVSFGPRLVLITDPADMDTCISASSSRINYINETGSAQTVYLIVDGVYETSMGLFTFEADLGTITGCAGPCDIENPPFGCMDALDLCYCYQTTNTLKAADCNRYCIDVSEALSGVCHEYTTPGYENETCRCVYDCDQVAQDHCEQRIYTNCSCSADDPCGLQNDGNCNEFCEIEFPDDYFDDAVDCSSR